MQRLDLSVDLISAVDDRDGFRNGQTTINHQLLGQYFVVGQGIMRSGILGLDVLQITSIHAEDVVGP